jgi:hypothetical protein
MKMKQLTLKQQYEFVTGLYDGWCHQEELRRLTFPMARLEGNIDLLSEFTGQDFKDDEDMKEKVEHWIEETGKKLRRQAEIRARNIKRRFKKRLYEACLSRYKRRKK